jgi:hypothetical protein
VRGELLRVLLVTLELPPAKTAKAAGNALPGSGFYARGHGPQASAAEPVHRRTPNRR